MLLIVAALLFVRGFSGGLAIKNPPAMQETWVWSLGRENPLEQVMATHSSILAWRIPWTEVPSGLQSIWSKRVGHNSSDSMCTHTRLIEQTFFIYFLFWNLSIRFITNPINSPSLSWPWSRLSLAFSSTSLLILLAYPSTTHSPSCYHSYLSKTPIMSWSLPA